MTIKRSSFISVPFTERKVPITRILRSGFEETLVQHLVGVDERDHHDMDVKIKVVNEDLITLQGLRRWFHPSSKPGRVIEFKREEINHMVDYPVQEYFWKSSLLIISSRVEFSWEPTLPSQSRK